MTAFAIFAAVLLVVGIRSVRVVPEDMAFVVERLGRYHRTLRAGAHVVMPFVDRIAFRYSLAARSGELTETWITHDNVPVTVNCTFRWKVADPQRAAYASADETTFATELLRTRLREWIAARRFDDVRETTRELRGAVLESVARDAEAAGVSVEAIEVGRIERARTPEPTPTAR
jgi:regulator of protease activity HflC (stomatin/prohibitin superfamily)